MFKAIARRRLERDLMQLVQKKGAAWCFQSELVRAELLQKQPNQFPDVLLLCHFVTTSDFTSLFSNPTVMPPAGYLGQTKGKVRNNALWVWKCWMEAVLSLPNSQRMEIVNQFEAQAEAYRQATEAKAEQLRVETAKQIADKKRRTAEKQAKVEAYEQREREEAWAAAVEVKQRQPEIDRWRLAFPRETAAIEDAADLAAQAKRRAQGSKSSSQDSNSEYGWLGQGILGGSAKDREIEENEKRDRIRNLAPNVNAEILRRIKTAPDQKALQQKLEEAYQVERERRHIEAQHKRAEKERQAELQAEEKKQAQVQDWRQRFPLQCAGLSDEEVLRQISKKP